MLSINAECKCLLDFYRLSHENKKALSPFYHIPLGVLDLFSIENISYDKIGLRFFYFCVMRCLGELILVRGRDYFGYHISAILLNT